MSPSQGPHKSASLSPSRAAANGAEGLAPAVNTNNDATNVNNVKKEERASFARAKRFDDVPDELIARPHSYRCFTPLLDRVHGRAISPLGTFSTGARSALGGKAVSPVAFYALAEDFMSAKHSRGVKRTEPRFQTTAADEASPGPIYKPYHDMSSSAASSFKFSRSARFPAGHATLQRSSVGGALHAARALGTSSASGTKKGPDDLRKQSSKKQTKCTFGVRHDHLTPKSVTVVPAIPLVGPSDPVAQLPKYSGKFSSGARVSGLDEVAMFVTPGPGHFLKSDFQSTTPSFSMGKPLREKRSPSPGPGAYRVEKFNPVSKPNLPTFARCGHSSGIGLGSPGWDSPGPALYAPEPFVKR